MLNSFGADLRLKGRQVSIYMLPFHSIANKWRSEGCTGIKRNTLLISIFAKRVPFPSASISPNRVVSSYV